MKKKKEIQREKKYYGYALSVYLAQKCNERDKQSEHAADGCDDGVIRQSTLASVLADEATFVQYSLTPIGYIKIAIRLFKISFFGKKLNGPDPVFRCAIFI